MAFFLWLGKKFTYRAGQRCYVLAHAHVVNTIGGEGQKPLIHHLTAD